MKCHNFSHHMHQGRKYVSLINHKKTMHPHLPFFFTKIIKAERESHIKKLLTHSKQEKIQLAGIYYGREL